MNFATMARRSPLLQGYWLQGYWRIPLIAVLGAILAFAGSFLVQPTYTSSTRLLIQAQDSTLLSASGQPLSSQSLVGTSDTSKTLAETYAAMVTSQSVAEAVVDQLHLDAAPADSGLIGSIGHGITRAFGCATKFLSSGFCAASDRHEAAVTDVQNGITAEQLGSTTGSAAGLPGSYILEVSATGSTAAQAQSITNAVADELVTSSAARFEADAAQYQADLQRQVDAADADVAASATAVATFRSRNALASGPQQLITPASLVTLNDNLMQTWSDLASTQAQLDAINTSLAATSQRQPPAQGVNPAYSTLVAERNSAQAALAGLKARATELQSEITGATPGTMTDNQVELSTLQQRVDAATAHQADLVAQLKKATSNTLSDGAELARVDQAPLPQYPIAPKRLTYLALGLLLGGLAGYFLTVLNRRRRTPAPGDGAGQAPEADQLTPVPAPAALLDPAPVVPVRQLQGAGAGRGATNGAVGAKRPARAKEAAAEKEAAGAQETADTDSSTGAKPAVRRRAPRTPKPVGHEVKDDHVLSSPGPSPSVNGHRT